MATTQEKLGKLKFSFNSTRDPSDTSKSLSYSKDLFRVSSPALRSIASPVSRTKNIQSPEPSMVEEILFQCRRLNPDFNPGFSSSNISNSVSQQLRKAVDSVLEAQNKLKGSDAEHYQQRIKELTQKLEESNKKLLSSSDSDKKLSLKEERLALEEIKLMTERKHIQNERNQMSTLKRHYLELEAEVKALKEELKEEKNLCKEKEKKIHELFSDNIEKETELQEFKNSASVNQSGLKKLQKELDSKANDLNKREKELLTLKEKLENEHSNLESQKREMKNQLQALSELKSKLDQETRYFESSRNELNSFKVSFELEQSKLRDMRKALEVEKAEIAATQRALTVHKSQLLTEVEDFEQEKLSFIRNLEKEEIMSNNLQSTQPDIPNKTSLNYFPSLQPLISEIMSELSLKALYVEKWFNHLQDCQLVFESRLDSVKLINALLISKLSELDRPSELEPLLSAIKDFLEEVEIKQIINEEDYQSMLGEFRFNEDNLQVFEKMLEEFVVKANEIQVLDECLQELNDKVQVGIEENARVARFLMEDRIQFQKEKAESKKEIEEATVILMQLQRKTDDTLEMISKREKEVIAFHQILDRKSPIIGNFHKD